MNEDEISKRMQQFGDRIVALGYATGIVVNDNTGSTEIAWTPKGNAFKGELQKLFDVVAKDKGEAGNMEFFSILTILTHTR